MNLVTRGFNFLAFTFQRILPRSWFWEFRTRSIDEAWGSGTDDYPVLREILTDVRPTHLIDIGCGTGRLFPLFLELGIPSIVGQDISWQALRIARKRFPQKQISFVRKSLTSLRYPDGYFDLCISNRVLSAIPPDQIVDTLKHIIQWCTHLYLNEYADSDYHGDSTYWFRHDYLAILRTMCEYEITRRGNIGRQSWIVVTIKQLKSA